MANIKVRGLAQVVKGWGGFVGGSTFNSQCRKRVPIKRIKKIKNPSWIVG